MTGNATMETAADRGAAPYSRILGFGAYRPERVITNDEVTTWIDTSDEWITTRSGITSRRFAGPHETLEMMGAASGAKALAAAGVAPDRVDCVIACSATHLRQVPGMAPEVALRLGARGAGAFDLSVGCAGFCHGLGIADALVRAGTATHVLVVAAERLSDITDRHDRSLAFLLADGAGAAVVGPADRRTMGPVVMKSDGTQLEALTMTRDWGEFRDDPTLPPPFLRMDGRRIFRWAGEELAPLCRRALDRAGVPVDALAAFVPHQANLRITELVASVLGLPDKVVLADDIRVAGNTSSASIPLAVEALRESGRVGTGDLALMVGFGAGLACAAQVVELP